MDTTRALRWGGYYTALATLGAVVGLAIVAAAATLGIGDAVAAYRDGAAITSVLSTAAPGLIVAALGLVVWHLIAAVALHRTMTGAIEEEMRERFDSERVKSEILAVLDDRLSDMQYEMERVRKEVSSLNSEQAAEEFEFGGD